MAGLLQRYSQLAINEICTYRGISKQVSVTENVKELCFKLHEKRRKRRKSMFGVKKKKQVHFLDLGKKIQFLSMLDLWSKPFKTSHMCPNVIQLWPFASALHLNACTKTRFWCSTDRMRFQTARYRHSIHSVILSSLLPSPLSSHSLPPCLMKFVISLPLL